MYLLSEHGRRHLLEFLRNLTPQVLLLSTALVLLVLWSKSEGRYVYLVLSIGVTIMCALAAIANSMAFLDNAFSHSQAIAEERDRLKAASVHGLARLRAISKYIWVSKRGTLIELLIAFAFVYGALAAILVTSIVTALRAVA